MARYIDADALIKKIYPMGIGDGMYTINAKAVKFAIDNTPTAEVVPSERLENAMKLLDKTEDELYGPEGEVTKLTAELNAMRGAANSYKMHYENAKAEVAREIFAEIEDGLQYEIDLEDKFGRNAWGQGDVSGFQTHEYTEDKLDTFKIAMSLLKKKYITKGAATDGDKQ